MSVKPDMKPLQRQQKLQFGLVVLMGLIMGSALIFFVAWSSSKQRMEEHKDQQPSIPVTEKQQSDS